jgi:hypothetical protein
MVNIKGKRKRLLWDGSYTYEDFGTSLSSQDPSVSGSDGGYSYDSGLSFTDAIFDGKEYTIKVFFSKHYYSETNEEVNYEVFLYSMSRASHLYKISSASQSSTEDNPFSQPVQVFSNVNHGMGIFGAFNSTKMRINVKEWEL